MLEVKELSSVEKAKAIGTFLTSENAFNQTWAPNEKLMVQKATLDSLENENHRYWYIEKEGSIIAAAGIRENKYGSGGYEMDSDYISVHREFRKQGLASLLLEKIEDFVKKRSGRYIHVVSCDIESYIPARLFYEKHGYNQVSHLPNYYVPGEGRIDFLKEL